MSQGLESGVEGFLAGVGVGMSQGLESRVRVGVKFLCGWSRESESESELLRGWSRESESEFKVVGIRDFLTMRRPS